MSHAGVGMNAKRTADWRRSAAATKLGDHWLAVTLTPNVRGFVAASTQLSARAPFATDASAHASERLSAPAEYWTTYAG